MYRGFNLKLEGKPFDNFEHFKKVGLEQHDKNIEIVQSSLRSMVRKGNILDGSAIQEEWFPLIEADVFISHSRSDIDLAYALSGWLRETFNLRAFVDSCVWGNYAELLREIDNENCYDESRGFYIYQLRNDSTSHVHMMLSTALSLMIDKAECLFFLNTPNSLPPYSPKEQTVSPWIYAELTVSQIIRKKKRERITESEYFHFDGGLHYKNQIQITHDVDTKHLTMLDSMQLQNWRREWNHSGHPLDTLYFLNS